MYPLVIVTALESPLYWNTLVDESWNSTCREVPAGVDAFHQAVIATGALPE